MEIKKTATAGTMESSDIMITLEPSDNGIQIELTSSVEKQFGQQIRDVIKETLDRFEIRNVSVYAVDKGALDCTVRARVETAVTRACEIDSVDWRIL